MNCRDGIVNLGGSVVLILSLTGASRGEAARRETLDLARTTIRLPADPAAVIPADLDGDGLRDLAILVAFTDIVSIGESRLENLVEIATVVPALVERRELRAWIAQAEGGYAETGAPTPLPRSILAVGAGVRGSPLVALTDDGVAAVHFDAENAVAFAIEPLIDDPPVLAGTGSFFPELDWIADLDGDGDLDLLVPSIAGPAVYLAGDDGLETDPRQRLRLPGDELSIGAFSRRIYPIPRIADVDGDGKPDLAAEDSQGRVHLLYGDGDGRFAASHPGATCAEGATRLRATTNEGVERWQFDGFEFLGDLDGDGRAEAALLTEIASGKKSLRAELKEAKRPHQRVAIHGLRADRTLEAEPRRTFEVVGHTGLAAGPGSETLFLDLDGDGRRELITFTLDFSILQALRVLTTQRLGIGFEFHIWSQQADGSFSEVPDLDLTDKLKLDLGNVRLDRLAHFGGDFDGDGRIDFVRVGDGRRVSIHRGAAGCRYPKKADLEILVDGGDLHPALVRVRDVDGDGRSDLQIVRPLPQVRPDVSAPALLELYLSGGRP